MKKKTGPATTEVSTVEALQAAQKESSVFVLAFFEKFEGDAHAAFETGESQAGGLGNRMSRQLLGCVWRCLCIQCRCRAEPSGLPVHVPAHSCLPVLGACTSSTSVQVRHTRRHRSLPPPAARAAAAQSNDDAAFLKTTSAEVAAKLGLTSAPAYALGRSTELFGFEAVPAAGHAAFEGERHCSPWVCRCPVLACE